MIGGGEAIYFGDDDDPELSLDELRTVEKELLEDLASMPMCGMNRLQIQLAGEELQAVREEITLKLEE